MISLLPPDFQLTILRDFSEEGWASMDLCADMLQQELTANPICQTRVDSLHPRFFRLTERLPLIGRRFAHNTDRLFNRWLSYPHQLRRLTSTPFDHVSDHRFYHVSDHSYAHLVHHLPAERTGVYCHDLDAFRCILEPNRESRPLWFRAMMRRVLQGLQKAAVVFCISQETRRQLEEYRLVDHSRIVHAPLGVAAEFHAYPNESDGTVLASAAEVPFLLHVGSCIPRKRIDVLLEVFAGVRAAGYAVNLVQAGGTWSEAQQAQMEHLGLTHAIHQVRGLSREELAGLYRQAQLVLLPSDAEGFGLPMIEALACGTVVIASDLPVLREVGGSAAVFSAVGDVGAWTEAVTHLLEHNSSAPSPAVRAAQAGRFTWSNHSRIILETYQTLCR